MSQFDKKAKMDEKMITSLTDLQGMYGEHTNLGMRCRVGWVQANMNPTTRAKVAGVFSAVLIGTDGIADLAIWDPDTLKSWQAQVGSIVTITGMSCSRIKPASLDWARAPGDYGLNVNKERYTITVMKGSDDSAFPKNGSCPTSWLRRAVTPPQAPRPTHCPWSSTTTSTLGIGRTTCCDAPNDATCKATGLAHVATCGTCNRLINDSQPFCSRQVPGSMIKCSPATRLTTKMSGSPFKEMLTMPDEDDYDVPAQKVLKMTEET